MTQPNFPSKPPAIDGHLGAVLGWVLDKHAQRMDGQMPAQIVSYDRAANQAVVQPLIMVVTMNGQTVQRAPIASVPVLALGGGGMFINFDLQAGDLGWIEASDRDISRYMQALGMDAPNTLRKHSFEDGRFVPDVFRKYTYSPTAGAMTISSLDGLTRVDISPGNIAMYATTVTVNATQTAKISAPNGLELDAAGGIALNGPITQGIDPSGTPYNAILQGTLTVTKDANINSIQFTPHRHYENGAGNLTNGAQN